MKKILYLLPVVMACSVGAMAQNETDSTDIITSDVPGGIVFANEKPINLHFQATYIYQYKPKFDAAYSGPNSLVTKEEKVNSITATLFFGARLWKGGELYINPEIAGGSGLSGAFGLGASTNGETFRVGNPEPTLYLARGYITQTIDLDHNPAHVDTIWEGPNEVGSKKVLRAHNYLKFYLGKMCLGDLFDNNVYANSPRTQFMNWCLMNNGAWDYAANVRGYTYTFATVLQYGPMTYKAAVATLPTVANGPDLNTDLGEEYSINAEVTRSYTVGKRKRRGNARLMAYHNNGDMGNYAQAMRYATFVPDVTATRQLGRSKTGILLNADQELNKNLGLFARAGWNDGQNETWCFTEADRSLSAGINVDGNLWKRVDDNLGFAVVMNGLSKDHRVYLAAGGLGFQLGDTRLSYANEATFEFYYSLKPFSNNIFISFDYQFIVNPGYNSARGPVSALSVRLHTEL